MKLRSNRVTLGILSGMLVLAAISARAAEEEAPPKTFRLDLSGAETGSEPEGLFVIDGEFVAGEEGGRKVLEMKADPLVEGLVLVGDTLRGGGVIRAKIRSARKGRSYPRFGVGLHGISGYRLRVVPAQKAIEIFKGEETVARQPYTWDGEAATWLELKVAAAGGGKWRVEATVWPEGGEMPSAPQLAVDAKEERFTGKGVLCGTPYSGLPIRFDEVTITPLTAD